MTVFGRLILKSVNQVGLYVFKNYHFNNYIKIFLPTLSILYSFNKYQLFPRRGRMGLWTLKIFNPPNLGLWTPKFHHLTYAKLFEKIGKEKRNHPLYSLAAKHALASTSAHLHASSALIQTDDVPSPPLKRNIFCFSHSQVLSQGRQAYLATCSLRNFKKRYNSSKLQTITQQ